MSATVTIEAYDRLRDVLEAAVKTANARADAAEAACAAMRKALAWTNLFRDFSDEWHYSDNESVVHFRALRAAALTSNAGSTILARLAAADELVELVAGDDLGETYEAALAAYRATKGEK